MLKIEKFTDVCMTGGIYALYPSHTNVCKFNNFQLTLESLSMTFTADGKRQRLPLIFYSFLVILK